ncbi:MAG: hypothetical protein WAV00_20815, partial [Nocardioides sp.]
MTERSAEQAPVQTRPDTQDNTARIPLAERLQRRVGAGEERKSHGSNGSNGQVQRESARVLPPPPPELVAEQAREQESREQQREEQARAAREQQAREEEARRADEARRAQES